MALDIFEVYGINGQVLKFLVDKDVNNQLSLVTQTAFNFPANQQVTFNNVSQPIKNLASEPLTVNFPTTQKVSSELGFYPARYNQSGSSSIVKASAGRMLAFKIENLNTSTNKFLMFFNQVTLPVANQTTNIIDVFNIPFGQLVSFDSSYFSFSGIGFNGLAWGWSSERSQFIASGNDLDLSVVSI